MSGISLNAVARDAVRTLRASKIREVANAGMGRKDVLTFWFGEPDEVTPAFICQAGIDALNAGETFYTHNLGIPELREAISAYVSRLHRPAGTDRVAVTNSGMSALMLTTQALIGAGIGLGWAHLGALMMEVAPAESRAIAGPFITTTQTLASVFGSAIVGMVANLAGLPQIC